MDKQYEMFFNDEWAEFAGIEIVPRERFAYMNGYTPIVQQAIDSMSIDDIIYLTCGTYHIDHIYFELTDDINAEHSIRRIS